MGSNLLLGTALGAAFSASPLLSCKRFLLVQRNTTTLAKAREQKCAFALGGTSLEIWLEKSFCWDSRSGLAFLERFKVSEKCGINLLQMRHDLAVGNCGFYVSIHCPSCLLAQPDQPDPRFCSTCVSVSDCLGKNRPSILNAISRCAARLRQ